MFLGRGRTPWASPQSPGIGISKTLYSVELGLFSGETVVMESAVTFLPGTPATIISGRYPEVEGEEPKPQVMAKLGSMVLLGTTGCTFAKPDSLSANLWGGFWQSAQHLTLDELDFYVYQPGADRITVTADVETRDAVDGSMARTFYGEIEQPYECHEIGKPMFMFEYRGYKDGVLDRETQFVFNATTGICGSMISKPSSVDYAGGPSYPSYLLLVASSNATGAILAEYLNSILDGLEPPSLSTLTQGPFTYHYYLPKSGEIELTLWEIAGEYSEDWRATSKLVGRTRISNSQPMPPVL